MLHRLAPLLLIIAACPAAEPATKAPEPAQFSSGGAGSSGGGSPTAAGHGGGGSGSSAMSAVASGPVVCPAQQPAECPAPTVCPTAPQCPAPTVCPVQQPTECPEPYPTMPTTYAAGDAWPLAADHPHALVAFCRVSIETVGGEGNITADVGCGDVNDARWNHINVRYTQTRTDINDTTGEITQVTTDRGCYGPHGANYADTCTPGAQCFVDYWIPVQGHVYRTAWGTCLAK